MNITKSTTNGFVSLQEATGIIHDHDRELMDSLYQKAADGKSWVCPFCEHGKGGDGISFADKHGKYTGHTIHCFTCNFSGDIISLYQHEHKDETTGKPYPMPKAVNELLKLCSDVQLMPLNTPDQKSSEGSQVIASYPQGHFTEYYYETKELLNQSPAGFEYLQNRGINIETALSCTVGFDTRPQDFDGRWNKYNVPRLIFFTDDMSTYNSRQIFDCDKKDRFSRSNKAESGFFNGGLLWELDESYRDIIITEGEFDCLSCMEVGYPAIALSSVSNIDRFINELPEGLNKQFIVCFDREEKPELDATMRQKEAELLKGLKKKGYHAIVSNLQGDHHDINDCLISNRDELSMNIEIAMNELNQDDFDRFVAKILTPAYQKHKTGLKFVDNVLDGGVMNQTLTILLAPAGYGKTVLCSQIAESYARNGRDVLYFCLEMSSEQLMARDIARNYSLPYASVPDQWVSNSEILELYKMEGQKKYQVMDVMRKYHKEIYPRLHYITGTSNDINDILNRVRKEADQIISEGRPAPVVFVDYLHFVSDRTVRGDNNAELLKRILQALKTYAINYDTFVFTISATKRTATDEGITVQSGRDSSNIEFTADSVIGLDYYEADKCTNPRGLSKDERRDIEREPHRRMVLKNLKMRGGKQAGYECFYFNSTTSTCFSKDDDRISPLKYRTDAYKLKKFDKEADASTSNVISTTSKQYAVKKVQ